MGNNLVKHTEPQVAVLTPSTSINAGGNAVFVDEPVLESENTPTAVKAETINASVLNAVVNQGPGTVIVSNLTADRIPIATIKYRVDSPYRFFKGRTDTISTISSILSAMEAEEECDKRILVVHGISGVGKSELMRKFVATTQYPNVAWINAQSETTIRKSFEGLADELRIEWKDSIDTKDLANRVYKHIDSHFGSDSLFIFDNSTNIQQVHWYLPVDQSIKRPPLSVMTTNEPSKEGYQNLRLQELNESEALDLCKEFLELKDGDYVHVEQPLKRLVNLLGFLPLGLLIALHYVARSKRKIRNLYDEIEDYIVEVQKLSKTFTDPKPAVEGAVTYPKSLKAAWDLTVKLIEEEEERDAIATLYLLRILGYIDPDDVAEKEVQELCLWKCPLIDNETPFAKNRHIDYALEVLTRLSIVIPVGPLELSTEKTDSQLDKSTEKTNNQLDKSTEETKNPRYRIHRLFQRFARNMDDGQIGLKQTLYHCLDFEQLPAFIFPGCLEYLENMIEEKIEVDEGLKQVCLAVGITVGNQFPDQLRTRLVDYFRNFTQNTETTKTLLSLAELSGRCHEQVGKHCGIPFIAQAINVSTQGLQTKFESYLIQSCTTSVILVALYTSSVELENLTWTQEFIDNWKVWVEKQVALERMIQEQDRNHFLKLLNKCIFCVYRTFEKLTEKDTKVYSMEDVVNRFVRDIYKECADDFDLVDGFWHIFSGFLHIKGCRKFLGGETLRAAVEHAADTLEKYGDNGGVWPDAIFDTLFLSALTSEHALVFSSSDLFLKQLSRMIQIRTKGKHTLKDIYWAAFLIMAYVNEPEKIEELVSSWGLIYVFCEFYGFIRGLIEDAALFYRRWSANFDTVLSDFVGGTDFLQRLQELATREPGTSLTAKIVSEELKKFLSIVKGSV